jgi:hypothetical protein
VPGVAGDVQQLAQVLGDDGQGVLSEHAHGVVLTADRGSQVKAQRHAMDGDLRFEPRRVELGAAQRLQAVDDRLLHRVEGRGQGDAEGRRDLRDLLQGRSVIGHEHRPQRLDRVGLRALLRELTDDDLKAVARRGLGQEDGGGQDGGPMVAVVAVTIDMGEGGLETLEKLIGCTLEEAFALLSGRGVLATNWQPAIKMPPSPVRGAGWKTGTP